MDDQNNEQNLDSYKHEIDESKVSGPFSNALKSISSLLQKMHLIKPDQVLIGDKDTNSRGYQTTSKNPLEATERKSLKAILRTVFEERQNRRADKIRAKTSQNKLQVHLVGQDQNKEESQTIAKDPTQEFVRPLTPAERAALRNQASQAPQTLINNTVILAETREDMEETLEEPTLGDIAIDSSQIKSTDTKTQDTQDVAQTPLRAEELTVEKTDKPKVVIPKVVQPTQKTNEGNTEHEDISM